MGVDRSRTVPGQKRALGPAINLDANGGAQHAGGDTQEVGGGQAGNGAVAATTYRLQRRAHDAFQRARCQGARLAQRIIDSRWRSRQEVEARCPIPPSTAPSRSPLGSSRPAGG